MLAEGNRRSGLRCYPPARRADPRVRYRHRMPQGPRPPASTRTTEGSTTLSASQVMRPNRRHWRGHMFLCELTYLALPDMTRIGTKDWPIDAPSACPQKWGTAAGKPAPARARTRSGRPQLVFARTSEGLKERGPHPKTRARTCARVRLAELYGHSPPASSGSPVHPSRVKSIFPPVWQSVHPMAPPYP